MRNTQPNDMMVGIFAGQKILQVQFGCCTFMNAYTTLKKLSRTEWENRLTTEYRRVSRNVKQANATVRMMWMLRDRNEPLPRLYVIDWRE